ncbi:MAG TPA: cytochrome d ubiquinol oxidase subunit II [Ktedonobacteraceae bacterium]|nr:cytochrome d ubiquinol oxidase subunit II [Ktedonobacteraceae bacterium]
MQTLWFILVAFMLSVYVLLDGFDLGAGIIHLFAAKKEQERRVIIRAIGPVWDGNEVWLIAAGGTLFFTFPLLYASSFSGFYLALMIVLWLLIGRGIAVELRSRIHYLLWSSFWDSIFFISSALLTIFFGVAMANVLRGVPLDQHAAFFEALWTDFNPYSSNPGILDWYTILVGLLACSTIIMHGANYITVKTEGPVHLRTHKIAIYSWIATVVLAILATIATFSVQPIILKSYEQRPWGYIFPIVALAGLIGAGYFRYKQRDLQAFIASGAFIVGMLASAALGIYPDVLPAANPAYSLTIYNASAPHYALIVGLIWWSIGIVLAIIYFVAVYRLFSGKVEPVDTQTH